MTVIQAMRAKRRAGLWQRDFLLLWGAQAVSGLGSQVTLWALPLAAVLALKATPAQMGLLAAAGSAPSLLVSLFAGAWADRVRRRPTLIAADVARALLLATVPLAAALGMLSLAQLYVVAFLAGTLGVFFGVAYQSFLPSVVERERLVAANGALEAANSIVGITGPGLAGVLVQLLTAPIAILADALSYVVSALALALIRTPEAPPDRAQRRPLAVEIGEGLRVVREQPILRALAVGSGLFNLFDAILLAVYVLYLTRTLGVGPALIGAIFALGSAGGLAGAVLAGRITRRIGVGPAMLMGILLAGLAEVAIALAGGPPTLAALVVAAGEAAVEAGAVLYNINSTSLRQALVPDRLQGRVAATLRLVSVGVTPLGALAGGILATHDGLRPTVLVAGVGTLLSVAWLVASPVRGLRAYPSEPLEEV